jgi:uncharacterized damage-inducible protein DinB
MDPASLSTLFLTAARSTIERDLPRIVECLRLLNQKEIWWRPNAASNSVGNLVLHLCGNVRQWIVAGLDGAPDVRVRDKEFSERGPLPRRVLIHRLESTIEEALHVLSRLPPDALARRHTIQGFHVTGLAAVFHVAEHFSYHTGQIIYITKRKLCRDLRFTNLPRASSKAANGAF